MRRWQSYLSIAVSLCVFAAANAAKAADFTPELQALIKAAQAEGTLNVSWAPASIGGPKGTALAEAAMNKMFGTTIKIVFTPGGMMPAMAARLASEKAAGKTAFTDVFMGSSTATGDLLLKYDALQPGEYTKYLPDRITDKIAEYDGRAVKLTTSVAGISYNKTVVPYPPKKLSDLLKPEWKGKIGTTPYAAGFDQLAAVIGEEKTLEFARKLTDQLGGLMRCNEAQRLASGEFGALVFECNVHYIDRFVAQGAPLAYAVPDEFNTIGFFYLSVPRNAEHPNLAKLYITFMQTVEGQKILWDTWHTALHYHPETQLAKDVAEMTKENGKAPLEIDIAWHDKHPEARKFARKVSKIVTSRKK